MKWAAPAYYFTNFRSWNKWGDSCWRGMSRSFVAGKYFGLSLVQWESFEICTLILCQQHRENSLPQELFGNVWRAFYVASLTEKNYWHLVERRRKVVSSAVGRTVMLQKPTEKHWSHSSFLSVFCTCDVITKVGKLLDLCYISKKRLYRYV